MWGIFFEDINFGADGGLYAELVKNGGFEFPEPMTGWFMIRPSNARGGVTVHTNDPFNLANSHYVRIRSERDHPIGISNEGYRGMGVRAGELYEFTAQARLVSGTPAVTVELVGANGETLAEARLTGLGAAWTKVSAVLCPTRTEPRARLNIILYGRGAVDFDAVSLFPKRTWKGRVPGLRADLVEALAALKPGFLRFPGGCIVEGSELDKRYQWKHTIGPREERRLLINRWNYEFKHRPTPDYYQSFGLGFFEFFLLAEDLGAEPLPIINCGMACQFNSGELAPLDQLDPYIQDALDLIEFANGPVTSPWGAKRAALGHPAPFNLKMLGIGNEQWGPQYIERYVRFHKVLKEKHPEIKLVAAAGPAPSDERFEFLWPRLAELKADIVDQHCYANPVWFFTSTRRFDDYPRNGPKVFFGEYAAQSRGIVNVHNKNTLECALAEAAFMTGMEQNADVVWMASYAPLLAHADAWQWTPNLIWFDNLHVVLTPNYYVQQLFSLNRGDVVLPTRVEGDPTLPQKASGGIGVGTRAAAAEFKEIRVTRGDAVLYASGLTGHDAEGWLLPSEGRWEIKNGTLAQTDPTKTATALIGDERWSDYTVTLKARKLTGRDGFTVVVRNGAQNCRVEWTLGAKGNSRHTLVSWLGQQDQLVADAPGKLEEGKWYDLRVVLRGAKVECYLDGQLVHSAEIPLPRYGGVFASAVRENSSGEIILKLVNATSHTQMVKVILQGVGGVNPGARGLILTSDSLGDVNDFECPNRVVPKDWPVQVASPEFMLDVPRHSFLVIRVPAF
ncbi:MAG: alpha-L-arabinofuranosidase C-terminal domain-containing protein [Verrucomicrobiales bacterium]|nr:alpha-L-arabinofuranosidase C-terminal domain-containing protein [Verrucomicrobiales bacterium]